MQIQVIEVLNENPVGQINSISNFKSRSKYWGSKYGVADRGVIGYNILVEANHQRWWCPKYTNDTKYHIGVGIPTTGKSLNVEPGVVILMHGGHFIARV
ncbi:hypothetical protein [Legionella erythra]|nr:hypothetical protein [Legionella erythra]